MPNLSRENACPDCGQMLSIKLAEGGEAPGTYFLRCVRCKYFYRFTTSEAQAAFDNGWRPQKCSPLLSAPAVLNTTPTLASPVLQPAVPAKTSQRCAGGCAKGKANALCKMRLCKNCCIDQGGCLLQGHQSSKLSRRALKHRSSTGSSVRLPAPAQSSTTSSHTSRSGFGSSLSSIPSTSLSTVTAALCLSPPVEFDFSPGLPSAPLRLPSLPPIGFDYTFSPGPPSPRLPSPVPNDWLRDIHQRLDSFEAEEAVQEEDWSQLSEDIQRELREIDTALDTAVSRSPTTSPSPPLPNSEPTAST
ncbi:hypothetical protein K435DRAFT_789273 [Dendrothele bispora CBS 962.96]|uniref:Uncharacterized protein n=1 Tax=Dendrothele bispora (strain CBS 962.96) TaxID=1314807 RepID=A0A4S8MUQ6_DENBC|nr:hypothetical protein K435DRAFT_789273 [Dendrothele bispora CBS 962.96]